METKNDNFSVLTLSHLMGMEFPPVEWVVESLIPATGITALSGAPASYKTWLVLQAALSVASGSQLCSKFATDQTGVLIVDEESGPPLLKKRLTALSADSELPIYFRSYQNFSLSVKKVEELLELCKEFEIGLVIFDSLVRIHGEDENDAGKMAGVAKLLSQFKAAGIAVLFTHHNRKQGPGRSNPAQDMRGSSDILAAVDCHLAIRKKDDYLIIHQTKLRHQPEAKPFRLDIVTDGQLVSLEFAGEVDEAISSRNEAKKCIPDLIGEQDDPLYQQELFEKVRASDVSASDKLLREVVKDLVKSGEIIERRGEKKKLFYSLPRKSADQKGKTDLPK
ncbi:MAG: AAA family ATPase [Patescibacteria group bacterium]